MKWDEDVFGREYDLGALRVVCVDSFNTGGTENKGLLIFNCHSLLTDPKFSTGEGWAPLSAAVAAREVTAAATAVSPTQLHGWLG